MRKALDTDHVRIMADKESVLIEPVKDLAGSLAQYARKRVPFRIARDKAWDEVVRGKRKRR